MFKKTDSNRSKLYAGFAGVAALALLTACGGDEPAEEESPADPGVEQEDPMQEDPAGEDPAEEDPMGEEGGAAEIEGAGEDNATSLVGLAGNAVSFAL
ncbi:hypothetical protein GCM10009720_16930 [Yaniella flava]|uniref:Uncharacterized protein n=1 Tax=Yaniella flava TaxID=287930 RepID=A0ABN2UHG2_9MICC